MTLEQAHAVAEAPTRHTRAHLVLALDAYRQELDRREALDHGRQWAQSERAS